ncbi:MAG: hypothetical protein ACKO96_17500, partial [Flammeovirgaceae bacterium]
MSSRFLDACESSSTGEKAYFYEFVLEIYNPTGRSIPLKPNGLSVVWGAGTPRIVTNPVYYKCYSGAGGSATSNILTIEPNNYIINKKLGFYNERDVNSEIEW